MPDTSDVLIYRERARQWQEAAERLPDGKERGVCLVLAEGYARLAVLIAGEELQAAGQAPI
ncbi:MAG: hypothetical protein AB7Q01_17430 [Gammaproteobacteria bacterium]